MQPPFRSKYLALANWLATTAKVPVDGTDLSGTTALMHSISTKPYLDTDFAKLMLENGADVNHRNRFGCNVAHDLPMCNQFDSGAQTLSQFEQGKSPGDSNLQKGPTPARNDACSCGSGKKYKKCCDA